MKVLHVITSLNIGGAEKLMVDLLPRFRDEGIESELAVFSNTCTQFSQALEKKGIKIHWLNNDTNPYSPRNLYRLNQLCSKYDIIHAHNAICQLYTAIVSIGSNKKFVTTEHSTSNRRRKMKFYHWIDKWMYSRYNRIICVSQKAEESLRRHIGRFGDDSILTINNGVEIDRFENALPNKSIRNNLPENAVILTMVGSLRAAKDQDTIIRAISLLPENFHFFIVGDGIRKKDLSNLAKSLSVESRVHFLGIRNDIPEILKASDFAIMSSHWEGFALSSVEGMSVGIPVLASDVDGLREVVKDAGVLFPHQDYKSLAENVLRLSENRDFYMKIANNCHIRARKFDISNTVNHYTEVYKSLLNDCQ